MNAEFLFLFGPIVVVLLFLYSLCLLTTIKYEDFIYQFTFNQVIAINFTSIFHHNHEFEHMVHPTHNVMGDKRSHYSQQV